MKAVLLSIQPKWCEMIASGEKTVEVRKTKPTMEPPFKCYIYCTNGKPLLGRCLKDNSLKETPEIDFDNYNRDTLFKANGKVIGEFVCDDIREHRAYKWREGGFEGLNYKYNSDLSGESCISQDDLMKYGNRKPLYGWHISSLVIYDKPMELSKFAKVATSAYDENGFLLCDGCDNANWKTEKVCTRNFCHERMIKRPPQSWCYVEEQ